MGVSGHPGNATITKHSLPEASKEEGSVEYMFEILNEKQTSGLTS